MNGLLFLSIPPFASEIDSLNATSRTSRYVPDFSPIHQTQSCKEKKKSQIKVSYFPIHFKTLHGLKHVINISISKNCGDKAASLSLLART